MCGLYILFVRKFLVFLALLDKEERERETKDVRVDRASANEWMDEIMIGLLINFKFLSDPDNEYLCGSMVLYPIYDLQLRKCGLISSIVF